MSNGIFPVPKPANEPVHEYRPGSAEKASLKAKVNEMLSQEIEIPLIIGGKEVRTGSTAKAVCPHDHGHVLATYHQAGPAEVELAAKAAAEAWTSWSELDWHDRAAVFLKAAELLAGPWRDTLNAATMLDQSKNAFQAEIDSACELVDFCRFNPHYMRRRSTSSSQQIVPRHVEPLEYRAAGGLRLRGHAVQLHLHRGQPAHRARP